MSKFKPANKRKFDGLTQGTLEREDCVEGQLEQLLDQLGKQPAEKQEIIAVFSCLSDQDRPVQMELLRAQAKGRELNGSKLSHLPGMSIEDSQAAFIGLSLAEIDQLLLTTWNEHEQSQKAVRKSARLKKELSDCWHDARPLQSEGPAHEQTPRKRRKTSTVETEQPCDKQSSQIVQTAAEERRGGECRICHRSLKSSTATVHAGCKKKLSSQDTKPSDRLSASGLMGDNEGETPTERAADADPQSMQNAFLSPRVVSGSKNEAETATSNAAEPEPVKLNETPLKGKESDQLSGTGDVAQLVDTAVANAWLITTEGGMAHPEQCVTPRPSAAPNAAAAGERVQGGSLTKQRTVPEGGIPSPSEAKALAAESLVQQIGRSIVSAASQGKHQTSMSFLTETHEGCWDAAHSTAKAAKLLADENQHRTGDVTKIPSGYTFVVSW